MDIQERPQNLHNFYQYIQTITWWWILIRSPLDDLANHSHLILKQKKAKKVEIEGGEKTPMLAPIVVN